MKFLEKQIKNKLKNHQVAWDKEALWEELETQLPQRPRRRRWLWGLWLLPLLILLPFRGQYDALVALVSKENTVENATRTNVNTATATTSSNEDIRLAEINTTSINSPERTAQTIGKRASANRKASNLNNQPRRSPASAETPVGPSTPIAFFRTGTNALAKPAPRTYETVTRLESLPLDLLPTTLDAELLSGIVRSEITPVASVQPRFFATADLGLQRANKTYELPANDAELAARLADNQSHLQARVATMQTVAIGCRLSNRLSATVGLGRQQIHERFNYNQIVRSDTITGYVEQASYFVQSSGDTLFFGGQGDYVEQDRLNINQTNRLSSTFIPLELHYAQRYRSLAFNIGAGAHWTAASKYNGRVLNADNEVVLDPYYQLQHRWGYALHLGVSFLSTRNRIFYARYSYRRSPSWDYAGVRQTFATYGLQVGVRVNFE